MNRKKRGRSRGKAQGKAGGKSQGKAMERAGGKAWGIALEKPGELPWEIGAQAGSDEPEPPAQLPAGSGSSFQSAVCPQIDSHWGMFPSKGVLLLLSIVLQAVLAFNPHDYALPLSRRFPAEPPQSRRSSSPPGQKPGPPSIRPPIVDEELGRMLERTRAFVRRYLTPSDVRHLQERIARAKMAGAGRERIRHVVWHFLTDALSPEQKMELAVEKSKLMMDFARS